MKPLTLIIEPAPWPQRREDPLPAALLLWRDAREAGDPREPDLALAMCEASLASELDIMRDDALSPRRLQHRAYGQLLGSGIQQRCWEERIVSGTVNHVWSEPHEAWIVRLTVRDNDGADVTFNFTIQAR